MRSGKMNESVEEGPKVFWALLFYAKILNFIVSVLLKTSKPTSYIRRLMWDHLTKSALPPFEKYESHKGSVQGDLEHNENTANKDKINN